MTDRSGLGDRMKKQYEAATRLFLPRRTYTIIRVDGRAFHTLLSGVEKPFDSHFIYLMDKVTVALVKETGAEFGYVQSDEVSVLLTDFATIGTEAWFGSVVQKMASVAAGVATAEFNFHLRDTIANGFRVSAESRPVFDGRVFTIPDPVEVANYFIWRQRDCVRNSISMTAQAYFSPRQLHGKNGEEMQEMLWREESVNWSEYSDGIKRGRVCERQIIPPPKRSDDPPRTEYLISDVPSFTAACGEFLASRIPELPSLRDT